jgi:hypothetical protein
MCRPSPLRSNRRPSITSSRRNLSSRLSPTINRNRLRRKDRGITRRRLRNSRNNRHPSIINSRSSRVRRNTTRLSHRPATLC